MDNTTHARYVEDGFDDCLYDYIIYTDGGYSRKHNIGAFSFVILDSKKENIIKTYSKKTENDTNNRAELKAIISGIFYLPDDARNVCVVSDSQYALKTLSNVWGRYANEDLFGWFDNYLKGRTLDITYKWVRGHSGDKWNELCDKLCNEAAGIDLNIEFEQYRKKKKN